MSWRCGGVEKNVDLQRRVLVNATIEHGKWSHVHCCCIFERSGVGRTARLGRRDAVRSGMYTLHTHERTSVHSGAMDPSLRKFEQIHNLHESLRAFASSRHNATCRSLSCHFARGGQVHTERRLAYLDDLAGEILKLACALLGKVRSEKSTRTFAALKTIWKTGKWI
jgi:hypothetical protein